MRDGNRLNLKSVALGLYAKPRFELDERHV